MQSRRNEGASSHSQSIPTTLSPRLWTPDQRSQRLPSSRACQGPRLWQGGCPNALGSIQGRPGTYSCLTSAAATRLLRPGTLATDRNPAGSAAWHALGSSVQCPESKSTKDQILLFHPARASPGKGTGRRKEDQRGLSRQRQAVGETG